MSLWRDRFISVTHTSDKEPVVDLIVDWEREWIFFSQPLNPAVSSHIGNLLTMRGEMEERVGARIHERQHTLRPHTYSTCFSWCGGRAVVGVRVIIKKYSSLLTPFMNSNFLFRYLSRLLTAVFMSQARSALDDLCAAYFTCWWVCTCIWLPLQAGRPQLREPLKALAYLALLRSKHPSGRILIGISKVASFVALPMRA